MSTGGIFKLIANDGKADRMIMATKLINQRIKDVMCARADAGKEDTTPTLTDLERTHILYVNAHFKPFAAIGYEYNKVRTQSGNATLGSGVTFSIPQFGDFFHDMVCRVRLGACTANENSTPAQSASPGAVFPANTTPGGYGGLSYNIVDSTGAVLVAGGDGLGGQGSTPLAGSVPYRNFVRYCEYPGNRLFHLVKFDVNGNPLDQYDEMVPVMLEKFCTPPNKRTGHDRLVGQEVPLTGYGGLCVATVVDADATNTPSGISRAGAGQSNQTVALFNQNANPVGVAPPGTTVVGQTSIAPLNAVNGPQVDVSRRLLQFVNGPQTPKPVQPPLELWPKLRFWFNDDVRLSIASVSIPYGMRYISMDLNPQSALTFEFPSIYLETVQDDAEGSGVHVKTYSPIFQKAGVSEVAVEKMELYINNIFVNPEIHDIYIKRIGFSLIRVYRQHTQRCNQDSSDEKLLSQLKWPCEYMMVGLRPTWNIKDSSVGAGGVVSGGNQNTYRDWHRLTRQVTATCADPTLIDGPFNSDGSLSWAVSSAPVVPDEYYLPVPTVDSLTLTSHGILIYDGFSDTFYNQYLPYHYGGPALVTPEDPGALFVNMALFPRAYQPSGHLNISRARETYLKWTTSYVSAATPADLLVIAVAINFLLITDGSAVLRYST